LVKDIKKTIQKFLIYSVIDSRQEDKREKTDKKAGTTVNKTKMGDIFCV